MMKNVIATLIAKTAKSTAIKGVNSACTWYFYQLEEPKKLKKLRKF